MKRNLLVLLLGIISLTTAGQENNKYYIYNIVSLYGNSSYGNSSLGGISVSVDNGTCVKMLRDENRQMVRFKTVAAVLMYFESRGWEIHKNGCSIDGAIKRHGESFETIPYLLLRKPCTEEELRDAVGNGIRKK